jgi:hypothetical protein
MLCHKEVKGQKMNKEAPALALCFAGYFSSCYVLDSVGAVDITGARHVVLVFSSFLLCS